VIGDPETSLLGEILAAVGFLLLTSALFIGHTSPARGYEVSVYGATPTPFWVAVGISGLLGVSLSFSQTIATRVRRLGYVLTAASGLSIAAIPIIRGYYFFGPGDSLTHLGWIRDITAGLLDPLEFLYPGFHVVSVFVSGLTGLPVPYSVEVVVFVFLIVYVVFVPLAATFMADGWWTVSIGILSALLFLPINNVSVFRMAHPTTQAILSFPFLLYLIFIYIDDSGSPWELTWNTTVTRPTGIGMLFAMGGLTLIFLHPQVAASVLAFLIALSVIQLVTRRWWPESAFANHRSVIGHTVLLGAVFGIWAPQHDRTYNAASGIIEGVTEYFGGQTVPADGAKTRGDSIAELGGGIEVLFAKLFGVSLLFSVIVGVFICLLAYRLWKGSQSNDNTYVAYAVVGVIVVNAVFLVYFLSSVTTQYFRQLGLIMAFVTVVGTAAFSRATAKSQRLSAAGIRSRPVPRPSHGRLVGIRLVLIVLLVASLATLYRSPYIYQPADQVPEGHVDGYELAFDRVDSDSVRMGIRVTGGRYRDAIYGVQRSHSAELQLSSVPPPVFNAGNYTERYNESRYLAISDRERQREMAVYEGIRYERRGLRHLRNSNHINRVISNGQVRVYHFNSSVD
jgi:multisubunit Na+/H+ antiporter MnhF subunit